MFDIGAAELLVIAIVAILVIGPKDMPLALRTAGRWIGQVRRISSHFRAGIDAMVREAELEDMEAKWKERNAQIMRDHPGEEMTALPPSPPSGESAGVSAAEDGLGADTPDAAGAYPDRDDPPSSAASASAARTSSKHSSPNAASAESRAPIPVDQPESKQESSAEPRLPLDRDDRS